MATDWIETNWWFPWASAEEAKVEAFRAWLMREPMEFFDGDGWQQRMPMSFLEDPEIQMRPLHHHRLLIDQYEPGQEWEISADGLMWTSCRNRIDWLPNWKYRLKPRAPAAPVVKRYRPWTPEEAGHFLLSCFTYKKTGGRFAVIGYGPKGMAIGLETYTYDEVMKAFVDEDGSPCGVEV